MMRADVYISEFGYAKSRQNAKNLIEKGAISVDGRALKKPSEQIDEAVDHVIDVVKEKYVSRGALKLEGALENFSVDVGNAVCIDIGASTGGFTDCLLSHGAQKVFAVDSGHGQLDAHLASDKRVVNIEGYNARALKKEDFPCLFEVAVMDVSFISQTYILGPLASILTDKGILISLIKPQFEAGRAAVGKNGIVKNKENRAAAIMRVVSCGRDVGLFCRALMRSPIEGGDGNIEYLAYFTKNKSDFVIDDIAIKNIVKTDERRS